MVLRTLAEIRDEKDKAATWSVKNVVLEKDKKPTIMQLKLTEIQIPQYESLAEFEKECGGKEQALAVLNKLKVEAAMEVGSQRLRYAKRGPIEDIIKKALEAMRTHVFLPSRPKKMTPAEFKLRAQQLLAKKSRTKEESEELIRLYAQL